MSRNSTAPAATQSRWRSPVLWAALAALLLFVLKTWACLSGSA